MEAISPMRKKKLSGAAFKVTAGADIYKADGTKVYSAGDVVAEKPNNRN